MQSLTSSRRQNLTNTGFTIPSFPDRVVSQHAEARCLGPALLLLTAEAFLQVLPRHAEECGLQAVREQPGRETAPEQTSDTVGGDDRAGSVGVGDRRGARLPAGLEHAQRVGDGVSDSTGGETDGRVPCELRRWGFVEPRVRRCSTRQRWQGILAQAVLGRIPWEAVLGSSRSVTSCGRPLVGTGSAASTAL